MSNPFEAMMHQVKEMQEKMRQSQEQLAALQVTGEAGAGMVKLTMNGNGEALDLMIDEQASEDPQILRGLILAAITDANKKLEKAKKDSLQSAMSGMSLPDNFKFPF